MSFIASSSNSLVDLKFSVYRMVYRVEMSNIIAMIIRIGFTKMAALVPPVLLVVQETVATFLIFCERLHSQL